jgi:predicted TIM-barrel fold metal-dependent hydrolase
VFADISFWPLNPFYMDMVPWNLLEKTVSNEMLLGSDYAAGQTPKEAVAAVRKLPISQDFKEKILDRNAAKILKLQGSLKQPASSFLRRLTRIIILVRTYWV